MSEKWKEIYSLEQIKKIQKLEIENLKVLNTVCEKLNIQFFLYGGSLIGAVRHKGFVPWDDDLDIAMMRDDYMKFVTEAPKLLPPEYFLQSPYNDKKSPYFYTKLRLRGTRCVEYCSHKLKIEHGIYVDIYPIDNMPESNQEFLKEYSKFQRAVSLFVLRQCLYSGTLEKSLVRNVKSIIRVLVSTGLKIIPHSCFVKYIDRIMTRYNNKESHRYGNYSYFNPTNLFRDIQPFQKGIFEGIEVNLPNNWDEHLKMRYGNYMELPPEEERLGHKPYILDFGDK